MFRAQDVGFVAIKFLRGLLPSSRTEKKGMAVFKQRVARNVDPKIPLEGPPRRYL